MIEFRVIGEVRNEPGHLVLLDEEGQCYDYNVEVGEVVAVEPDARWAIDVIEEGRLVMVVPEEKVVSGVSRSSRVS